MEITVSYADDTLYNEKYEKIILRVVNEVASCYGLGAEKELSVLLCDNEYIKNLNRDYRGLDKATDVLSFALNEGNDMDTDVEENLLGDIVISLERTAEQGKEYGHGMERELAYLTVHGCLHILGYDHMTVEDKAEMREEEEFVLGRLGYVREDEPYRE